MARKVKTVIHVNQHVIRQNKKKGTSLPAITVKRGKSNQYCHEVAIGGPCRVIYDPKHPLSCGAVCYLETHEDVEIIQKAESHEPSSSSSEVDGDACRTRKLSKTL